MKKILFFAALASLLSLRVWADTQGVGPTPVLPKPYATQPIAKFSKVTGWPKGKMPEAPKGFTVTKFAGGLDNPRWIYVLPNGDVLISGDRSGSWFPKEARNITLLRDADGDGIAETRSAFLENLNRPFGMALVKDALYVGEQDAVRKFPYRAGDMKIDAPGEKILDLPAGGYNYHWTRNLLANKDGSKLYVTVGSASNDGEGGMEHEKDRAGILEINLDGSGKNVFASGLRNPVGLGLEPGTGKLWTAVNERDDLGDDLVPDFMTSITPGGFYGWPYFYFGAHPDPNWKGQTETMAKKVITPDYALGAHTASLGLAFFTAKNFPAKYRGGVFIAQHGSWNRSKFAGYKVIFIPFRNGRPSGPPEDFLTGFMPDAERGIAYGRPVGAAFAKDGSLLVADDAGGMVWRVQNAAEAPRQAPGNLRRDAK